MRDGMSGNRDRSMQLSLSVGIATKGRPDQVAATLDTLARQTLQPRQIIVCCTSRDDVGAVAERDDVTVVFEKPGLARQRNRILRELPEGTDIVVFFDDDFIPDVRWLEIVERTFLLDPTITTITGHVVADGIIGPGLTLDEALDRIARHDASTTDAVVENYVPYGCNMAFRHAAITGLTFDEKLVLYGWLEDRDFGAAVAKRGGRTIKLGEAFGVHLGVKGGRVSGVKFGYSQVMNPIYMLKKETMSANDALRQIGRNVTANLVKSMHPEPYVDRRGRLRGNIIAAIDLLRRRLTPERAASL